MYLLIYILITVCSFNNLTFFGLKINMNITKCDDIVVTFGLYRSLIKIKPSIVRCYFLIGYVQFQLLTLKFKVT